MTATDWPDGGHANTTLWFGTDGNIAATWVEVGATAGWHAQNAYKFYFAHRYHDGSGYHYLDVVAAQLPVVGHYATFRVTLTGTNVIAKVTDETSGVASSFGWSGHAAPFDKWQIGAEYTCAYSGGSSEAKTYVYDNRYRRSSDGLWLDASAGTLVPSGHPGTGIVWCSSPVYFRFWVQTIGTTGCN